MSVLDNTGDSILQRRFTLGDLVDRQILPEVCNGYTELFQVGFKLLDQDGQVLVDTRGANEEFCSYLFTFPQGKQLCTRQVSLLRQAQAAENAVNSECFCGLRYLILPVKHEGNILGKLIFGPYQPAESNPPALDYLGEKFRPDVAGRLRSAVRRINEEVAGKVAWHILRVLEAMLYISYKHVLTSRVHLESINASYNELQQKNRTLQESFERLKELDRLKSNFLATISHELRTPLTSIIGYSEMLLEGLAGQLSPEQHEYVSTVMEKGEQLLGIINSILDFSKLEAGRVQLKPQQINVKDLIRGALTTMMPIARKAQVNISLAMAENLPPLVADAEKFSQILLNLLSNAVKFNRPGGRVEVIVDTFNRQRDPKQDADIPAALRPVHDEYLRLQVRDTGIGIAANQLERIFDSFYQVDGSSTREFGGTGLGLTIVRGLVEAHGGTIEVASQPGQGSTFTVLLPLEPRALAGGSDGT